jgi:tetratricopeptide (TPR) repeat protein
MSTEPSASPPNGSESVDRPARGWIALAAVLTLVCVAHHTALGGDFVWDDRILLADDRVQHLASPIEYLVGSFWDADADEASTRAFYRPAVTLSLALDHALHHENPAGYHLTNLALHLVNLGLLVGLLRRRGMSMLGASLAGGLWALQPRLCESVDWISGRTDVLAATGIFAALTVAGNQRASRWRPIVGALLLLLGLLAKEVALAGAIAWLAGDLVGAVAKGPKHRRWPFVSLAATGAAVAVWWTLRVGAIGASVSHTEVALLERGRRALEALGTYAWMTLDWPRPCARIGYLDSPTWALTILGVLVLGAAAVALGRAGRWLRSAQEAQSVALLVASLAPTLHLAVLPTKVVAADRFLYVPWAACVLLLAPWLARVAHRRLAAVIAVVMTMVAAATTHLHASVWTDEVALWEHAAQCAHPNNPAPLAGLAGLHHRVGDYRGARDLYRDALARIGMTPESPAAVRVSQIYAGLASAEAMAGNHRFELFATRRLAAAHPDSPRARYDFALALLHSGDLPAARALLTDVAPHLPATTGARRLLGEWSDVEAAARLLQEPATPVERAAALARLGRRADAEAEWATILPAPGSTRAERAAAAQFLALFASTDHLADYLVTARALGVLPPALDAAATERLALLARLRAAR